MFFCFSLSFIPDNNSIVVNIEVTMALIPVMFATIHSDCYITIGSGLHAITLATERK